MREPHWSPPAEREFHRAVRWYAAERPGVDIDFTEAVYLAVQHATEFPDHGSPDLYGTRKMVLQRFPYDVSYIQRGEGVYIIAVAHHSRKPGYWRRRLRNIH